MKAKRVAGATSFSVCVDGIVIGSLDTNARGRGKARFSNNPRGKKQLLGVDPSGTRVTVSTPGGEDVLECDIPDDEERT